jgi:hypothetical protein
MNTVNGQQVDRLISWKVEEMLDIQNPLEEAHNLLVQLYIGVLISHQINGKKLMLKNQSKVLLLLTISTSMDCIGTIKFFTLIWTMIQTEFYKLITVILHIGTKPKSQIDIILGNSLQTNALHSTDNFI